MPQAITSQAIENYFSLKKVKLWLGIIALIIGLSVFQDYIYSRIQNTGFYISESLLYNNIWVFIIPFSLLEIRLLKKINFRNKPEQLISMAVLGILFTILHILLFSSFFVAVSYLVFSPTHHFSGIFNAALSNQFYVLVLFYTIAPFVLNPFKKASLNNLYQNRYPEKINVKTGSKIIALEVGTIEVISTSKPYTMVISREKTYLDNRTLKDFEAILNPDSFVRVHRSSIINKNKVKELNSRQNGDYDCLLNNGQLIRLSRHYRKQWQELLH